MKRVSVVACLVVLTAVAFSGSQVLAQQVEPARTWIIEPNGTIPRAELEELVVAAGGTLLRVHDEVMIAVALSDDPGFGGALETSQKIRLVTRDLITQWRPKGATWGVKPMQGPEDEAGGAALDPTGAFFYPCQWNMSQIDAEGAWAQGIYGAPGVKVAVLDSGIDPYHLDLGGHVDLVNSTSMLTPGSSPCNFYLGLPDEETFYDFQGHGTFVSALIAGNGLGMAAIAPDSQIVSVKVLTCDNFGSWADIFAGILYAASLADVHVINMSIQGGFPKNIPGIGALVGYMNSVVNYAQEQGKLVVSAAGNYGVNMDKDRNFYWVPAQSGGGIATWAGDIDGDLASYSNFGRTGTWVGAGGGDFDDLDSPSIPLPGCFVNPSLQDGVLSACSSFSIWYNCPGTNYYLGGFAGTSFSAPLVSGIAAAVDAKHGGALQPGDLKTILSNTADDVGKNGVDAIFSHGRVNAGEAATQ